MKNGLKGILSLAAKDVEFKNILLLEREKAIELFGELNSDERMTLLTANIEELLPMIENAKFVFKRDYAPQAGKGVLYFASKNAEFKTLLLKDRERAIEIYGDVSEEEREEILSATPQELIKKIGKSKPFYEKDASLFSVLIVFLLVLAIPIIIPRPSDRRHTTRQAVAKLILKDIYNWRFEYIQKNNKVPTQIEIYNELLAGDIIKSYRILDHYKFSVFVEGDEFKAEARPREGRPIYLVIDSTGEITDILPR